MNTETALQEITEVAITDEGKAVSFRVKTVNGQSLQVSAPAQALHQLIRDLLDIAQKAALRRTGGIPVPIEEHRPPILSNAVITALAIGESTEEAMLLMLRLHDFDVSFRFDRTKLAELAENLTAAAHTLSTESHRKH